MRDDNWWKKKRRKIERLHSARRKKRDKVGLRKAWKNEETKRNKKISEKQKSFKQEKKNSVRDWKTAKKY